MLSLLKAHLTPWVTTCNWLGAMALSARDVKLLCAGGVAAALLMMAVTSSSRGGGADNGGRTTVRRKQPAWTLAVTCVAVLIPCKAHSCG